MRIKMVGAGLDLPVPEYQTQGAAGFDLQAALGYHADGAAREVWIGPGEVILVPCGVALELPAGWECQVRARSGLAKRGIGLANGVGTVDSDYRGEMAALLVNLGSAAFSVRHGDRIAQGVLAPVTRAIFVLTNELGTTARGAAGFGSTGISSERVNTRDHTAGIHPAELDKADPAQRRMGFVPSVGPWGARPGPDAPEAPLDTTPYRRGTRG